MFPGEGGVKEVREDGGRLAVGPGGVFTPAPPRCTHMAVGQNLSAAHVAVHHPAPLNDSSLSRSLA